MYFDTVVYLSLMVDVFSYIGTKTENVYGIGRGPILLNQSCPRVHIIDPDPTKPTK